MKRDDFEASERCVAPRAAVLEDEHAERVMIHGYFSWLQSLGLRAGEVSESCGGLSSRLSSPLRDILEAIS